VSPLRFTRQADADLASLEQDKGLAKRLKAVRKALGYLELNPRHQGQNNHEYGSLQGANGEKVFEAYAENQTPAAYRIFWHHGPGKDTITIIAITAHP
jgi:bisphosphoglycerate-dependent phosphoglycerate mutase